jgi:hypothetical protein
MATNIAASVTATAQQILIPMIRQVYPSLIAQQILGVQPMTGPTGEIFTMRTMYDLDSIKFRKKYKFSRAKWYMMDFDIKYYIEVKEWCAEQFGKHDRCPDAWSRWWHRYESTIYFRDEDDAIMFKLRWPA